MRIIISVAFDESRARRLIICFPQKLYLGKGGADSPGTDFERLYLFKIFEKMLPNFVNRNLS